jgi:hypothetical protein
LLDPYLPLNIKDIISLISNGSVVLSIQSISERIRSAKAFERIFNIAFDDQDFTIDVEKMSSTSSGRDFLRSYEYSRIINPLTNKLNDDYSFMYYDDISFRNRVLSKIFNPYKQLHLDLSWCLNIEDVSSLGNVHTLNLRLCDNIEDVSALGKVHNLNLSYCDNITDVSALGYVHNLDLSGIKNITDLEISALQNFTVLKL